MTLIDVLALLALAVGFIVLVVFIGIQQYRLWKVLNDPEHPDHELAKEALKDQHRQNELDRLRFE